ncbi:hypothetical protein [Aequorivita marisscotiae]|uniref:DUF2798 domain-containing protein n=1 Tax=Aequorivita marisscotiae TaxID=3040348 RepID=A0ABY8L239_9FLAO|nr:hypothetical protein [Aequorivita sp. Ant34-E75]WGF94032.1 hypothetical protein QCQ61_07520 [Aequorivita sp. Ant34-E75]
MTRIIKIATILFQVGLTIGTTSILYMLFAMFDYQGGFANFVGLTLFQPILAILISILTVIVCGLVGLPIRLNNRLNTWWRSHFYVSILIGLLGLVACAISLMPGFIEEITYRMDGMDMTQTVPNQILSISGWFLVSIGTLHLYPPKFIQDKLESLLTSKSVLTTE